MPQATSTTRNSGWSLKRRCPYQAKVMNTFERQRKMGVRNVQRLGDVVMGAHLLGGDAHLARRACFCRCERCRTWAGGLARRMPSKVCLRRRERGRRNAAILL